MPRHCPDCGLIPERNRYLTTPTSGPTVVMGDVLNLTEITVLECECGWAEDVEP